MRLASMGGSVERGSKDGELLPALPVGAGREQHGFVDARGLDAEHVAPAVVGQVGQLGAQHRARGSRPRFRCSSRSARSRACPTAAPGAAAGPARRRRCRTRCRSAARAPGRHAGRRAPHPSGWRPAGLPARACGDVVHPQVAVQRGGEATRARCRCCRPSARCAARAAPASPPAGRGRHAARWRGVASSSCSDSTSGRRCAAGAGVSACQAQVAHEAVLGQRRRAG